MPQGEGTYGTKKGRPPKKKKKGLISKLKKRTAATNKAVKALNK